MAIFEIWMEGYAATGEHSPAHKIGEAEGETFDEACINFCQPKAVIDYNGKVIVAEGEPLALDKNPDGSYRRGSLRTDPGPGEERIRAIKFGGNYSIWACQLFDNEQDARKSFG